MRVIKLGNGLIEVRGRSRDMHPAVAAFYGNRCLKDRWDYYPETDMLVFVIEK
jgi:hypothetical protein